MTPPYRILDAVRRSRRTLYVIASFYVAVGFWLALPAAVAGDRLSTFLGFLIISGALAVAVGLESIFRLNAHVATMTEQLIGLRERLNRIERAPAATQSTGTDEPEPAMMDLATMGRGDPDILVAATLDRSVFPRLVSTMDDVPPTITPDALRCEKATPVPERVRVTRSPADVDGSGVTTRNLMHEWEDGLRTGDLAACRNVFSALVDIADPATVVVFGSQLEQLAGHTEAQLREAFLRHARERDYSALMDVGEEICRQLPDRPIAVEFNRIKPHVQRRLAAAREGGAASFRVVR